MKAKNILKIAKEVNNLFNTITELQNINFDAEKQRMENKLKTPTPDYRKEVVYHNGRFHGMLPSSDFYENIVCTGKKVSEEVFKKTLPFLSKEQHEMQKKSIEEWVKEIKDNLFIKEVTPKNTYEKETYSNFGELWGKVIEELEKVNTKNILKDTIKVEGKLFLVNSKMKNKDNTETWILTRLEDNIG